jgi:HD-GYP domain-containing protein (c-di-GMP phosphodiesterase class II)
MTTARHYRRPVDRAAALAECRRERGRQFCPEAVRALHEVLGARAESEAA